MKLAPVIEGVGRETLMSRFEGASTDRDCCWMDHGWINSPGANAIALRNIECERRLNRLAISE